MNDDLQIAKTNGRVLVVARNVYIAERWAKRNGVKRSQFIYVFHKNQLYGFLPGYPIFVDDSLLVDGRISCRLLAQELLDQSHDGRIKLIFINIDQE